MIYPVNDSDGNITIGNSTKSAFVTFDTLNKRVGIGTDSPEDRLHFISSSGTILDGSTGSDTLAVLTIRRSDVTSRFIKFYPSYTGIGSRIEFGGWPVAQFSGATVYSFNGSVGINTTTPQNGLNVGGTGNFTTPSDTTTAFGVYNSTGFPVINVDTTNERVGIGTASPTTGLRVSTGLVNTGIWTGSMPAQIQVGKAGEDGGISFSRASDGVFSGFVGQIGNTFVIANSAGTSSTLFYLAGSEKARITSSGLVGINTTSPTSTLHVVGNASVSTNLFVKQNLTVDTNTIFVNSNLDRV